MLRGLFGAANASGVEIPLSGSPPYNPYQFMPGLLGTRIGVYQVGARIGVGGMGEVYRARDLKLDRDVALKVLPDAFAHTPDRLRRFEREAKTLASLNHPNIASIHGFEESEGVWALVMEFVDGEDLSQRIARGALPIDEALPITKQIAEALEAAHEQGVIHRDLKPANIKVRPDGTLKVLDFGLATAIDPVGSTADAAESPTITALDRTAAGVVLGTAAYMSPEQARGRPLDKRTDIWAFGCVFYEMLTRRAAFHGETFSDTIAGVLEREPDWNALPDSTPPGICQLLKRCLEKDPKQRTRDIGDVRLQLEDSIASASRAPAVTILRRSRTAAWQIVVATLAVGAIAILGLLRLRPQSEAGVPSQTLPVLTRATADDGVTADPALSRDGALLTYASDRAGRNNLDIWIQQASGGTPIQLTHDPVDEREPAFSPDGRFIAFRSEADGGGIYIIPSFGGQEPRLLVREGRRPRFSPDGNSIAYWTGSNIGFLGVPHSYRTFTVPTAGGAPREVGVGMTGARYPVWSRDGRSLLVLGSQDAGAAQDTYDWWLVPLAGRAPVKTGAYETLREAGVATVSANTAPETWLGDRVLFSDFKYVWSIELSPVSGRPGSLERLTLGTNGDGQPAVSDAGTIAFSSVITSGHIWALPLDTRHGIVSGAARRLTNGTGMDSRPSLSADGNLLTYIHGLPRRGSFVKNLKTGSSIDLGEVASGFGPAISPDGRYVTYETDNGVSLVPSRGGSPRAICKNCTIGDWANDSRETTVVMLDAKAKSHLSIVNVETGAMRDLTEPDAAILNRPFLSDGNRLLAFREFDPKGNAVYVGRVPTEGTIKRSDWLVVVPPETDARPCGWSPDGSLLYFLSARDGTRCLYAQRLDPSTGRPQGECFVVQHFSGARNLWASQFGVVSTGPADAMRGGAFLYDVADASSNIWLMSPPPGK